jgi:hypothetical protein
LVLLSHITLTAHGSMKTSNDTNRLMTNFATIINFQIFCYINYHPLMPMLSVFIISKNLRLVENMFWAQSVHFIFLYTTYLRHSSLQQTLVSYASDVRRNAYRSYFKVFVLVQLYPNLECADNC